MKRGGPLRRRKPIRRVSERRLALLGLRVEMLEDREGSVCAAEGLIPAVRCSGPVDPHEPLTRARGGSIVDSDNVVMLCRRHHSYVHRHQDEAHALGLLRHSWERS